MWLILLAVAVGNPDRHVLFLILDGLRPDTLRETMAADRLPNHRRLLSGASEFTNALTVFPSVTLPANASLVTGALPAQHGIPGNHWYDVETQSEVNYFDPFTMLRVYTTGLANQHLRVPTIYERTTEANLSSFVVFHPYWRGATRFRAPSLFEALTFWDGQNIKYDMLDRRMMAHAIHLLNSEGQPNLFTLYFPGTDAIAHAEGIAAQADYLANVTDPLLGQFLDSLDAVRPTWREDTLIILTSDHGRTSCDPAIQPVNLPPRLEAVLATSGIDYRLIPNGPVVYVYLPESTPETHATLAARIRSEELFAEVFTREDDTPRGFFSDRAPDLLLTLPPGHFYRGCVEASSHGSAYRDDSLVPLYIANPTETPSVKEDEISTTTVVKTIGAWLGLPDDSPKKAKPASAE